MKKQKKYKFNVWVHQITGAVEESEPGPQHVYQNNAWTVLPADPNWKEEAPVDFHDTLTFVKIQKTQYSSYAEFKTSRGNTLEMLLSDLSEAIPLMENGKLTGDFGWTKTSSRVAVFIKK